MSTGVRRYYHWYPVREEVVLYFVLGPQFVFTQSHVKSGLIKGQPPSRLKAPEPPAITTASTQAPVQTFSSQPQHN